MNPHGLTGWIPRDAHMTNRVTHWPEGHARHWARLQSVDLIGALLPDPPGRELKGSQPPRLVFTYPRNDLEHPPQWQVRQKLDCAPSAEPSSTLNG